jgi:ATP-dependent Clp protease ATP-binding subunit ClpA
MIFAEGDPKNEIYPYMRDYTSFLKKMERPLIGREKEMKQLLAAMQRPELCNAILLADAGSGKTALVQGTMLKDTARAYLEVDLPKMIANLKNENEMADKLKQLFREVAEFRKAEGKEIVLFIDEFHQIVQLSAAAVEVLKPLLADSGTRGIRVIAATTYIEFQQYIAPNLPLVERLQRINLPEPDKNTVISILKGMAERYGVLSQFPNDSMFEAIYEYTNRYIPANAQPRKSILMMDSMIGWHRLTREPIDMKMLANVIYETEGINIAFRVDAANIKRQLDEKVLAQDFATRAIENRLQICCADLNNKNRPMSSFLFTGSSGVGKQIADNTLIPVYTDDNHVSVKRNGDLKVGDYVFDRLGRPTKVTGVFPQGVKTVYEVELADGRVLEVGDKHLWTYKSRLGNGSLRWKVADTVTLMEKLANKYYGKGRKAANIKFVIPMNQAVQWPALTYKADPYVFGVLIGNGCLTDSALCISSADEETIAKCASLIGNLCYVPEATSYSWRFVIGHFGNNKLKYLQVKDYLSEIPEFVGLKSHEKYIPDIYKHGSIEQRWSLIQGLFDTDGTVDESTGRYNVSYSSSSKKLLLDIQDVLFSLGIQSTINNHGHRNGRPEHYSDELVLHVACNEEDKPKFFSLKRKLEIAQRAAGSEFKKNRKRVKKFGEVVGIRDIRKTERKTSMTCIMVDNEEHLYQAGQYVVTHNTEVSKQLAHILFEDERSLIRMDMTEYALPESLERFRQELTQAVWARPYCIVLLDEIEKACAPVTRILLQVLDDGRLLDRNNREVTFKNAYIIVTTNAGSEIYKTIAQYNSDDTGSGKLMEQYEKLIRESIVGTTGGNKFPPELLGRIDCIVPFQPLSEQTMTRICMMKLNQLRMEIKQKHHVDVYYDKRLFKYIVQDKMTTDSDAGGARGVVSRIEREVTTEIAKYLNTSDSVRRGSTVYVQVEGDLMIDNKRQLESKARVVVSNAPLKTFEK